jgi:predicted small lipoprotein YifL
MMRALILPVLILALAGCGARGKLKLPEGETPPPAPYGAAATPTADDLTAPTTQQRPQRSDELLRQSEERPNDPFQLPPQR